MTTSTRPRPQMGLDETGLDDPTGEIARLLDDRESAMEILKPYNDEYKGLDKQVKAKIAQLELSEGTYRCGEFIITVKTSEPREVSFERASSTTIRIRPAKS